MRDAADDIAVGHDVEVVIAVDGYADWAVELREVAHAVYSISLPSGARERGHVTAGRDGADEVVEAGRSGGRGSVLTRECGLLRELPLHCHAQLLHAARPQSH